MLTRIQLLILLPFFYQNSLSQLQELYIFFIHASGIFLLSGTRGPLPLTAGGTQKQGQGHGLQLGLSLGHLCLILDLRQGQDLEAMRGAQYSFCLLMVHVL